MNFLEKVKTSRNHLLYLVRGKVNAKPCWHYIIVEKDKLIIFKKEVKTDFIDLDHYGKVLESGWGENPAKEIADRIKGQYS